MNRSLCSDGILLVLGGLLASGCSKEPPAQKAPDKIPIVVEKARPQGSSQSAASASASSSGHEGKCAAGGCAPGKCS